MKIYKYDDDKGWEVRKIGSPRATWVSETVSETYSPVKDESHIPEESSLEEINQNVDHPSHYNKGNIEVIDFILDQGLGFCEGNVVKYLCRAPYKGNELDDLRKARFYLNTLIAGLEKKLTDE